MTKLDCFPPSGFSLRSNFPKLVFGHLHLSMNEILSLILMQFSCLFINTFINPKSIAFVETFSTMQLLQFFIFLSFLASVSAFYGKVPGQQRMFEEYYKNDQPRGDYNWIPHFGMRENYKFMTTFKPDVSNVLYSKMNSFLLIIYFFAANGQPRVAHFL